MLEAKGGQVLDSIDAIINIDKFVIDERINYELDTTTKWVNELLEELKEDLDTDGPIKPGNLSIQLELLRQSRIPWGNHLIVRGALQAQYQAPCVRCLTPTDQSLDIEFGAAFVNERFEKDPEYEEVDSIYADGDELDLYFHHKGDVDLKEMIHEQIYMNVNPLPLHSEDCKGLCPVCGVDLNKESCGHQSSVQ